MLQRVNASNPDERMPSKGNPLSAKKPALLRAWVDEGLAWPKDFLLAQWRRAPLTPRAVKLPNGRGNPIDRLLVEYFPGTRLARSGLWVTVSSHGGFGWILPACCHRWGR